MPKISELNAITNPLDTDLIAIAHDVNGLPSTKKITIGNFANSIAENYSTAFKLSVLPTTNTGEGYVLTWDDVANTAAWQASLVVNSTAVLSNTSFIPTQNNTFSLGSPTAQWKSLYVSNNTIYIGGIPVTVNDSGQLAVNGSISTGYTGSAGTNGTNGYTGSTGTNGYTGSVGIGYTGSTGTNGYTGSVGIGYTGSAGTNGSAGYTGSAGTNGYTGSTGSTIRSLATVSVSGPTVINSNITFADPNAAGANVNLMLPSSPTTGSVYTVKNINAGGHVVYIQTDGVNSMETESGSIGSGVYATISSSGNYLTWVYDGSTTTYRRIG